MDSPAVINTILTRDHHDHCDNQTSEENTEKDRRSLTMSLWVKIGWSLPLCFPMWVIMVVANAVCYFSEDDAGETTPTQQAKS